jgi:D-xylose 1-dehydrogenase
MTTANYPSLKGRRVLVTGGGSGIGAGIVKAFAAQGAEVIFIDIAVDVSRSLERSLSASPIAPEFRLCDLTDLGALEATLAGIGAVDVLVNNAANDDRHTLSDITPQYWENSMAVNLRHLLFCTKAVVPGMIRKGGGVIINFSSISWHLGLANLVLYETAKAGIEGMTRALARDLGPDNIRVNCIVPGNVRTPRQTRWYTPEDEAGLVAQQCLKSRLDPAHVAALVLFLASDDGRLCTGHEYWIDAGWA